MALIPSNLLILSLLILSELLTLTLSAQDELIRSRFNGDQDTPIKIKNSISVLPQWLQEYVAWHKETREKSLNDPNTKFLILACHRNYACGGLSDRLRPLPYYLLAAYKTNRLFFIKWQKFELEDFLVPPQGGLDWRLPKGIDLGPERPWHQKLCETDSRKPCEFWEHKSEFFLGKKNFVIGSRNELYSHVKNEYFTTSLRPNGVYSDVMNILFKPSEGLNTQIFRTMKTLGLRPKSYLAAHFRDRYPYMADRKAKMTPEQKQDILHNSIDCVMYKHGGSKKKVYFTSDKSNNVKYLVHESPFAMKDSPVKVVGIDDMMRDNLDEGVDFDNRKPEEFYSIFVDMFLLAHSSCVAYGQGGYGLFGARFSGEKCMIQHQVIWNTTDCPSALDKDNTESKTKESSWLH